MSRWLNVLLILTTFIAYLAPYISPTTFWPISIFGLAFPLLFILNFLFFLYWIFRRKKYFLLSLCCMLLGWGHFSSNFGINGSSAASEKNEITVINFNTRNLLHVYQYKDKEKKSRHVKEFENWLSENKVDVFLFQETSKLYINEINKILNLPHSFQPERKMVAILSRYPIISSGMIELNSINHLVLWADLKVANNKIIRFYSLHLKSSSLDREAIDAVAAGKVREKETWSGVWGLIKVYKNHAFTREGQSEKVLAHIRKSPYPVVVGGDFNEPPTSYVYQQFHSQLEDAFCTAGSGFGSTYAGKIPLMKIDYLFYDPRLRVLEHEIDRQPFSDHYPVKTRLSW